MTRFVDMPSSAFNKEEKLTRSSLLNPEPGPSPHSPASHLLYGIVNVDTSVQ